MTNGFELLKIIAVKLVSHMTKTVNQAPFLAPHFEASFRIAPKFSEEAWEMEMLTDNCAKCHPNCCYVIEKSFKLDR